MSKKIAVVGSGAFGALVGPCLAQAGVSVTIFERHNLPLRHASFNTRNRLHLGFQYPHDDETLRQRNRGFQRFQDEFGDCILGNFENAYFIASEGSLTAPADYSRFCNRLGLRHRRIVPSEFWSPVSQVRLRVVCDDVVYDSEVLSNLIFERLSDSAIRPLFDTNVTGMDREEFRYKLSSDDVHLGACDAVVNCTYADINRLTEQLTLAAQLCQCQYTMAPIMEWNHASVGITTMDGPFITVLPSGKAGRFLRYLVALTVGDRTVDSQMPSEWIDRSTAASLGVDRAGLFDRMRSVRSQACGCEARRLSGRTTRGACESRFHRCSHFDHAATRTRTSFRAHRHDRLSRLGCRRCHRSALRHTLSRMQPASLLETLVR